VAENSRHFRECVHIQRAGRSDRLLHRGSDLTGGLRNCVVDLTECSEILGQEFFCCAGPGGPGSVLEKLSQICHKNGGSGEKRQKDWSERRDSKPDGNLPGLRNLAAACGLQDIAQNRWLARSRKHSQSRCHKLSQKHDFLDPHSTAHTLKLFTQRRHADS
jgi:hypothetical protein